MDLLVRVLALGALLASAASAEPLVVRASGGVSYDSNVFRLQDGLQPRVGDGRDDLIALGQIGARGEANVSLQQFVVDASATRYEFSEHKSLSFTGLAITGTWNWQVGSRFAGSAGYDLQRRQTSFAEFRSNGRNIVTVKQPFVEGRYLPGSTLFAYGGYRRISGDNSSPILDVSDYRSNVASGGVGYALRNGGELRLGARRTDPHFPNNQPVVIGGLPVSLRNDYRLDEIEAQVRYPFSVKTSLTGRLAYTERKVDQASQRDFSGLTGRLALDYRPSALWAYQIVARRELTSNDDIQTNFVTTKGIAWSVEWRPRPMCRSGPTPTSTGATTRASLSSRRPPAAETITALAG